MENKRKLRIWGLYSQLSHGPTRVEELVYESSENARDEDLWYLLDLDLIKVKPVGRDSGNNDLISTPEDKQDFDILWDMLDKYSEKRPRVDDCLPEEKPQ